MSYRMGHVKRDPASGAVAIRTAFDENNPQLASLAWLVGTYNLGPRSTSSAEVTDWDDLYTPPVDE